MKTLKESILADMDSTIDSVNNAYSALYPVPTIKDFKKDYIGRMAVVWQCPELVKKYLDDFNFTTQFINKNATTGIKCIIDKDKTITTEFVDSFDSHEANIKGVGDWVSNSLPAAKKACIEFLTKLAKDPDNMFDKMRAYHNKCVDELLRYGVCNHITYAELETKKI